MKQFDVIVIGTGVAGQTAAGELAEAGKHVAAVDRREFGGTCALRGCEPKKVLYNAAEVIERFRGQAAAGLSGEIGLDWPSLMEFKRSFTDPIPLRIEKSLQDSGVTMVRGQARFASENTMDIDGATYAADHFVVATGALPLPLEVPGAQHVLDNEQFMALDELGKRIVFVGGGYISFEFAHIAAAAGARATIVHRSAQVLKEFDPDLTRMLVAAYREAGIDVFTDAPLQEVRESAEGFEVALGDGKTLECDRVVHGAGRAPVVAGLDLDTAGVTYGRRGIEVDASMRTTGNSQVFAAGDVAELGPPLTPVGIAQARVAVANILDPGSATFFHANVPSVAFTHPPLASVGLSEAQAVAEGLDVEVRMTDTTTWASSRRMGIRASGAKTVVERGTGRIVGVHLLGPSADEVINVFAAAMAGGLTADDIRSTLWAYPTGGSENVYLL